MPEIRTLQYVTGVAATTFLACILLAAPFDPPPTEGDEKDQDTAAEQQAADEDAQAPAANATPERVIVIVNRRQQVAGTVSLEDDHLIIIRDKRDRVHEFAKSQIREIIRLVVPKENQRGRVHLINGQSQEGIVLEDTFEQVVMEIHGVRAVFKRAHVHYVTLEPTLDEQYATYRESLDLNDVRAHMTLCNWLIEHARYTEARAELLGLLSRHDVPAAERLLHVVQSRLALQRDAEDNADPESEAPDTTMPDPVPAKYERDHELLTEDEVNMIRVYEIDFDDPPLVSIERETIASLIQNYGTSKLIPSSPARRQAMYRLSSNADRLAIAQLMFELRAREFYGDIKVTSEPASLNRFRRRVHDAWLIKNCATSKCHGGGEGGDFNLHRRGYQRDRVRYTNLMILERLDLGEDSWPLINYDEPTNSLLIQYALPLAVAKKPHPPVRGWRPVFTQSSQVLLDETIGWIESMMYPRPAYPVDFDPNEDAAVSRKDGREADGT